MRNSTTKIIFLFATLFLITICKSQSATTTIVIDDFTTGKGEINSFNENTGTYNCFSSYACTFELLSCKTQSSSSILGGQRNSYSYVIVAAGTETDPTNQSEFKVDLEGDVSVSNESWYSNLNVTNTGSSSWFVVTYNTQIEYISDKYCGTSTTKTTPIDLTKGGGNFIAFSANVDSTFVNPLFQLSVEDVNNNLGYAFADSSYYDEEIGQYIVEMNLQEDDVDVDFTQVTFISIESSLSISYPLTIDPNDFNSINVVISDVRVISIGDNNNNGGDSTNTSDNNSSKSSKSSNTSNSSNSSDSSMISPVTSLVVLLFCIVVLFV